MISTKLILIRHGQTLWNKNKRYNGFTDISLSKQGKLQAKKLHARLKNTAIDKIYASDRKRALQTAKIIFRRKNIEKKCDLREIHFGIFEGLNYKQILEKHPILYKKWLNDPYKVNIPNGESLADFKKRILSTIKRIIKDNKNKTVAIVGHGGAISIFINHLLKAKKFWDTIPQSASLSIVEHKNGKIKISLFNDISHLVPPLAGCH